MRAQKSLRTAVSFIVGLVAPARPTEQAIGNLTLEHLQALARYDGTLPYREPAVRALVWELKYRASAHARELAGAYLADLLLAEAEDSIGTLLIIPIPMHKARRKERGHNQTELLCESALKYLSGGFTYAPHVLERTRATVQQQGLERHVRLKNLKNSMQVTNPEQVKGRVCIVVDDVSTTGATFAEAKRALKEAGGNRRIAAGKLGISLRNLYRKLHTYHLEGF